MPRFAAFPHRALALAALSFAPIPSAAQEIPAGIGTIEVADPTRRSDGTVHPAALAAQLHGPLPVGAAEAAYQAALDRAREKEPRRTEPPLGRPTLSAKRAPLTGFAGTLTTRLSSVNTEQENTETIAGWNLGIHVADDVVVLFDDKFVVIQTTSLNRFGGLHPSVVTRHPEIIWDAWTRLYYYVMMASFGATENRVAFGFSMTANPNNLTSAWCHYTYSYASRYLDSLSLGDNRDFILFSGNALQPGFVGPDSNAVSKPPPGPIITCPAPNSFKTALFGNLRDSGGVLVSSPVAANQIDDLPTGYVLTRHGSGILELPSNKLWLFNITKHPAIGNPLISPARQLTVPNSYGVPPVAEQPNTRRIHTLDARPTNAVQARNPDRSAGVFSFWTQHTVGHPTENRSIARWYEIDPAPNPPAVLRTGTIGEEPAHAGRFIYNAAISPDRRVDGATRQFGDNFVITYNFSSSTINPSIGVASSVNGNPLTFRTVKNGVAPYIAPSCPNAFDICRWAGAGAAPDPRPPADRPRPTRGVVFGATPYSGDPTPGPTETDWFALRFTVQP